tara:strand:+ start:163 stop:438 length:276 start_codon:yes stop_codon:yes gene_type:complete
MTQLEMHELIKQHHYHLGEKEVRKLIDRALADFAAKTEMLETSFTTETAANQRYYSLPSSLLKITSVWLNDTMIPQLLGKPVIDDDTSETS